MADDHATHRRVKFDFEVDFSNGGGLQGQDFRLDIEGEDISEEELARYVVEDMRLVSNSIGVHSGVESRIRTSTIASGITEAGIVCFSRCLIEGNVITGNGTGIYFSRGGGVVLGNVIVGNAVGLVNDGAAAVGYGNNVFFDNFSNLGGDGCPVQLHPNVLTPPCF